MTKRVAMYLRVSTSGQTVENQRRDLDAVIARMGWRIVAVYEDAGISGAKGRDQRPEFDQLCRDAARRRFDLVTHRRVTQKKQQAFPHSLDPKRT